MQKQSWFKSKKGRRTTNRGRKKNRFSKEKNKSSVEEANKSSFEGASESSFEEAKPIDSKANALKMKMPFDAFVAIIVCANS